MRRIAASIRGLGLDVPARREWRFVTFVAVIALLTALSLSVWSAWLARPNHSTGFMYWNSNDAASYLDPIWQAHDGHWLFIDGLSSEPQPRVILRPLLLVLGKVSWLTHLHPLLIWDGARVLFAGAFAYLAYFFIAQFFRFRSERRLALIVLLTSAGLGLLYYLGPNIWANIPHSVPTDVSEPESTTFSALLFNPLFTYSLALLTVVVLALWKMRRSWPAALVGAVAAFLLVQDHPYDAPTVAWLGVLVLAFALVHKKNARGTLLRVAGVGAGTAASVAVTLWSLHQNSVYANWNQQNALFVPPWQAWLLGYGPLLVLALVAVVRTKHTTEVKFLALWLVGQATLLLSHAFNFSRRLSEGMHFPLALLATLGLLSLVKHRRVQYGVVMLLALTPLTTMVFMFATYYAWFSRDAVRDPEANYVQVYPDTYAAAADWLRSTTGDNDVVLTSFANGALLASLTGRRVVLAHDVATAGATAKRAAVLDFYGGRITPAEMQQRYGVTFVWVAREERSIPNDAIAVAQLRKSTRRVFSNADVEIYGLPPLDGRATLR